jgi:uncharacterized protein
VILADSGVFVALYNADDEYHERCVRLWDDSRTHLLVSPLVVAEVCYFLARDHGAEAEASFLETFAAGHLVLATLDGRDLSRMVELVRKYSDAGKFGKSGLGASDASVIALAERLGITQVATVDRRHFHAVRPAHCEALTLLP